MSPSLKLLYCALVTACNNLQLKICYKNIMDVSFLKWDSLFWRSLGGGGERERRKLYLHTHKSGGKKKFLFEVFLSLNCMPPK